MSEMFIPIPPWLKEGREKGREDKKCFFKCCKCGLDFVGYELPAKCPFCESEYIIVKYST